MTGFSTHSKNFKQAVLVCFCLLGGFTLPAQMVPDSRIDSVLASDATDTAKAEWLFEQGRRYWFSRELQGAKLYLKKSGAIAEENRYDTLLADAYNLLANVHLKLQQFDSSFYYLQKALDQKIEKYNPLIHETYSKIYFALGDYPSSLHFALLSADGFEKSTDSRFNLQAVYSYHMAGDVLEKQGQSEKAIVYFKKAYEKGSKSDVNWYVKIPALRIANYYLNNNEFDKARHLYDTIISLDQDSPSHEPTMHSFEGLGNLAMKEGDFKTAIFFFKKAIAYAKEKDLLSNVENFYTRLGAAFFADKKIDSASVYFQEAIERSTKSRNLSNLSQAYLYLSQLHEGMSDYQRAIQYFKRHKNIQDSILSIENSRQINNLEILYQTRQKEGEILRLTEVEREKNFVIQKRNTYIAVALVTVVVLFVIIFLLKNNYRNKQRLHKQTVKQMEQQQQVISLQSMINGQEAERTRIARDLHDGLGGLFSTIKMYLGSLQQEVPSLKEKELFGKSYSMVDTASEEVRRIAHNMMPQVLLKLGLINAMKDLCANISATKLLNVKMEVHGMDVRLNSTTEIMLFRIMQELLNNIVKHAQATEAIIQFVREENRLSVIVEDNGKGFNAQDVEKISHAGITTIQNRVAYLNGKVTIDSQQDVGTTVMMDFLINESHD